MAKEACHVCSTTQVGLIQALDPKGYLVMARAKIAIGVFLLLMTFQAIAMDVMQYQNLRDDRRIFAGSRFRGFSRDCLPQIRN
jgi:hypothetical protein